MESIQSVNQELAPKPLITSRSSQTIAVTCYPHRRNQESQSKRRITPLGQSTTYLAWAIREQALLIVARARLGGKQMHAMQPWYRPPISNVMDPKSVPCLTSSRSTGRGLPPSSTTAQCRPITRLTATRPRPCRSRRWLHTKRAEC